MTPGVSSLIAAGGSLTFRSQQAYSLSTATATNKRRLGYGGLPIGGVTILVRSDHQLRGHQSSRARGCSLAGDLSKNINATFRGAKGPKPGMALGSLKSHWFSAIPMKSRMAGSLAQALRKAARVNSAGTPLRKNATMSVSPAIDSMDGRLAGSNGASGAAVASEQEKQRRPLPGFRGLFQSRPARQRFSGSLIAYSP